MNRPTHPQLVKNLAKPGQDIINTLTASDAHLLHMAVGVAGEAGELLDAVKKAVIYRKPLDIVNVVEEVGDLLFYIQGVCQEIGVSMEECKEKNIDKLLVRHGEKYSDQAAQDRKDKQ